MSLLVHLPFVEDLRSKGLIELPSFSKNGFTSNANGKLGSCYSGYGIVSLPEEILGNAWSVATWVKSTATWPTYNYIIFCKNTSTSTDCQIYFSIINGNSLNLGMNDDTSVGSFSYTFELNVWYHVAATYDGETYRLYINGSEVKSGTSTLPMVENRLHLGIGCRSYNAAGTSATGQADGKFFNDFRLYNNAISAREVKELSKGLVAHWKLDDLIGNENLLSVVPRSHNAKSYNAYQLNLSENLVAGQTYTMQLWDVDVSHSEKTDAQTGVWIYWGGGSVTLGSWYGTANFTNGHADHLVKIFTVTSANASGYGASNAWLNLYNSVGYVAGTMNMKIGRWKLEKGSTPTPWLPAKTDDMYSDWEFNIAHDSSGYCHDGEQIGDVSISSSTPRYLSGTHIESLDHTTNRYNVNLSCLKMPIEMITPEELTIAFWGNLAKGYGNGWQGVFSFSNSTWPTDYLAAAINQYDSNFCFNSSDGSSHVRLANNLITVEGEWHHYALTYDGKTCRAYRDGELKTSGAFSADTALGSFTHLFMGLSVAGSVWRKNTCDYSDVRVYATALSDDDIKELYSTSASIDNFHNVYARELVED